ncbi:MAG: alternative ribosome rescue aminoacyl-tRNA hydrolase ArfB [Acidimicrobiales bacterium]|nr:alternative ribosome rescue aminoacyl-tRNA hydrolase ArfB [Acidimicrobiales bacterium]
MSGGWTVPESEIVFRFTASGGPGGQHANRSNTKVIAVWRPEESLSLPLALRDRVVERLGDVVRVAVDDERSQTRNREIAVVRIRARVANALVVERTRRATKATRASKRRRVDAKRQRGEIKRGRQQPRFDD